MRRSNPDALSDGAAVTLRAVFRQAVFYGIAGFGGGYSILAQLRRDLVAKKHWLGEDDFLVLAELSKTLPGTPATNLLALLGQRVAGWWGGLVAATGFVLPSAILMTACAAAYSLVRAATGLGLFFDGMNAAMVGIVGAVTVELGRTALRSVTELVLAALCCVLLVTRTVSEPALGGAAVVLGAFSSLVAGAYRGGPQGQTRESPPGEVVHERRLHAMIPPVFAPVAAAWKASALVGLAQVFVPIGVLTFGGGLAMIPAIEHLVVIDRHWLDPVAFADAVALGQITPGPVAICATFIGYRVAGIGGALVATIATFGPATLLTLIMGRYVERFRTSPMVRRVLHVLAPAVIGMLAGATMSLGRVSATTALHFALAAIAFAVMLARPISPLWLLAGGGLLRVAASAMQ